MPLFNAGKLIGKILRIWLSWITNLYGVLLYGIALIVVYNKIMYGYGKINLTKENLGQEQ